jgi:DNA-binding transcriptional MocR family regulator
MSDMLEKWDKPVATRGFAQVPNYLLLLNQFLEPNRRLSPLELLILIQLIGSWWKKEEMPFPSMATLAARCGVSDRQIQRAVNSIVDLGWIGRRKRRSDTGIRATNAYDLHPLVARLTEVAKAFPNEFPRNVQRAKMKEISERLFPATNDLPAATTEVTVDDFDEPASA